MGGKASPEAIRRASKKYYWRNRNEINAKKRKRLKGKYPKKDRTTTQARAGAKLRYAVWSGKIQKPDECTQCGARELIHGHHKDYSKPLEVEWLCASCHAGIHAK